ncbi:hypothetical protein D3C85_881460 [compost metagenome]
MNAEQLVKMSILQRAAEMDGREIPSYVSGELVDEDWDNCEEDSVQDAKYEFRGGEVETDIEAPYSRHYESNSVAACVNGEWVGWTYWYGGGKHGEPSSIDWIEYAYKLDCKEEQKVVTVRTFKVKE